MAMSDKDKLLGFETDLLFKLCLYYSYGPDKIKEVAALFNKNHMQRVSPKQLQDAYLHMHDKEHASYKRARDINRKNPEQLKNILKDELHFTADRLRGPIIKPSKPMAGVRQACCNNRKKKFTCTNPGNSTVEDNLWVVGTSGEI